MQKVFDYIRQNHMIQANDKVIVGVSGGADSLCLLFVLREYQRKVPFSMAVVHVEHGVRGKESLEDEEFVKKICLEYEIPVKCFSFDVPQIAREKKISVEEAGRIMRYQAFEQMVCETGADKIAVAHNQNDQAETMLWNMARGSGIAGAGGIRPVRGKIIRPLLCLQRCEIEDYLQKRGILWRDDRTNEEMDYTRNCIRHHILPAMEKELNAKTIEHMAALAEDICKAERYLKEQAGKAAMKLIVRRGECTEIDVDGFLEEEELIQELILRECLSQTGCGLKDVTRYHFTQLGRLFTEQSGRRLMLPGGWEAVREFSKVRISRKRPAYISQEMLFCEKLQIPGVIKCPEGILEIAVIDGAAFAAGHTAMPFGKNNSQKICTEWLNYDRIKGDIYLRTRQPGDYLTVNREGGRKKLKEYFIEEKIPAGERDKVLVLACGKEILWVVGHRISEAYKISAKTDKVLKVQMKED